MPKLIVVFVNENLFVAIEFKFSFEKSIPRTLLAFITIMYLPMIPFANPVIIGVPEVNKKNNVPVVKL